MRIPITKLAPTVPSTSREMNSCAKLLPNANTNVGIDITMSRPENTTRGP